MRIYEERAALLYTLRKPKSVWAATNKARVERHIATGLMQLASHATIEVAQRTGSWDTLSSVDTMTEPEDLIRAFAKQRADKPALGRLPTGRA